MSTTSNDPTLEALIARVAALEQAVASLQPHPPTPAAPPPASTVIESSKTAVATESSRLGTSGPCACSSAVATVPAVQATGTSGADGVDTSSDTGVGLYAISISGSGVSGWSSSGIGVYGFSDSNAGVWGNSSSGIGVVGQSDSGTGVQAQSNSGTGVQAQSNSGIGLHAVSGGGGPITPSPLQAAIFAESGPGYGLFATSYDAEGVQGTSTYGIGVVGQSEEGTGVFGRGASIAGVASTNISDIGVYGLSYLGTGVQGYSPGGYGLFGASDWGTGIWGYSSSGIAGNFEGAVKVWGTLHKYGGGFQIDHPLDAAHKYLFHSFVESPDMKNLYDGVVTLDANGQAEVRLPDWFETLNTDVRYQLTCLGSYASVYIAEKLQNNRFTIAGGKAGMEVCWQITGIRQDRWANAHRIPVEQDKPAEEQGYYLSPDLYGEPEEKSIIRARHPDLKRPVLPQK